MQDKTVREMSSAQRLHNSLAAKIFRAAATGCILLGLVVLIIGLGLYSYALSGQIIRHAFDISTSASNSASHGADALSLANEVLEIYRGLSEDERQLTGTTEYRDLFSSVDTGKESNYDVLVHMLDSFMNDSDISYLYLAMYDEATCSLVYIADPDTEDPLMPGEWESVTDKGMHKFLNWDGTGMPYDIARTEKYGWMCTTGSPIRDGTGEIRAFVLADVTIDKIIAGMKNFSLQVSIAVLIITAIVAVALASSMRKKIAVPIDEIAEAAEKYVADRRAGKKDSDHFAMLNIRTGDEVENLSLVMADMERDLTAIEDDLTRITAEKERISTELSLATRIQAAMLPHIFPPFPGRKEFDIFASMDPAKEIGGDFYDYFLIDDDHLCLVMADVSGKGIPAALFMMASKIILQSCAMLGSSPSEILSRTNEAICSNNQEEMFVTVWVGILEISTGRLTASSAGHEYPVIRKPGGRFKVFKDSHGFVIGGMPEVHYENYDLDLEPGSMLFLYTDGLPEATNAENTMFGIDRITAALNDSCSGSPREILQTVKGTVTGFVGNSEQFDDLTMLCIQYNGPDPEGGKTVKELTVDATLKNIAVVTEFIDARLEELDCPFKAQTQIDVAVDEIVNNIASYAYPSGGGEMTVRFEFREDPRTALISFIDSGTPFNPLEVGDPDVTLAAEDRDVGGLGVFLVKKTMDAVSYKYENGKNVLQIEKLI